MQLPLATLRLTVVFALLAGAALAPYVAWHFQAAKTLEVVIVDKSAPFRNDREHAAVSWLLHAMKVKNRAGRFLDPARDCVGFDPASGRARALAETDLSAADVLLVADSDGGLTDDEARLIETFFARGGMVIGEFNAFASPTGDEARARLEKLFGLRWTRWTARYWPNLRDANEVPRWIGRLYERATGHPFDIAGGGLVFVREDGDIVVLRENEDLRSRIVSQERTPGGAVFDFPERGNFVSWIDVVESTASEVLYEHVVDATPAGEKKLAEHGLSRRFPAVTRRWEAWYLAGDFVDAPLDLGSPERAALLPFRRMTAGCGGATEESLFWGWYAPIVSRLLASRAR